MFRDLESILFLIVLVAAVGLGVLAYTQKAALDAANARVEAAEATAASYKSLYNSTNRITAAKEKSDEAATEVLDRYQEWADVPVPRDVANLLLHDPVP